MMMAKLVTVAALLLSCEAFLAPRIITFRPLSTKLYLEDHIARMIDAELQRLQHKNEIDRAWHQKNEKFIERDIPTGFDFEERTMMENVLGPRQRRKDKALARDDPQAYCADRCVSTGNCEVFEDMFDFTPQQVMQFCKECVLSEDEEPCDIPDALLKDEYDGLKP